MRYSKIVKLPTLDVVDTSSDDNVIKSFPLPSLDGANIDVMTEMSKVIREQCGHEVDVSMDRMIIVHVTSPYVPSLDVVDLPGIVATSSHVMDADIPSKTRLLVQKYISSHPDSIYLAVVESGARFCCAPSLEFVRKYNIQVLQFLCTFYHGQCNDLFNLLQSKTVGVVTKCDLISTKALKDLRRSVVDQDVSVGSVLLEPYGYVCTMHDTVCANDFKENRGGDIAAADQIFMNDSSNYSRLIRQDALEIAWFEDIGHDDMLTSGHAGSRSIVCKLNRMYMAMARSDLIPKVLLHIHKQREVTFKQNVALGLPLPPNPTLENSDETLVQLKTQMTEKIRMVIIDNEEIVHKSYAVEILEPLMSSIKGTSTGKMEFSDCLCPQNSVEKWLCKLQHDIKCICMKSIERAKSFWCELIEKILIQDMSAFKMARFTDVTAYIVYNMKMELNRLFADLQKRMELTVNRHIETINLYQGVSVKYEFGQNQEKVTLTWDGDVLAQSLVYHLCRSNVFLRSEDLIRITDTSVQELQESAFNETCADMRKSLSEDMQRLEEQFRVILDTTSPAVDMTEKVDLGSNYCCRLKSSGLEPENLLKHGFTVEQLRQGMFTVSDLLSAGVAPTKLYKAGFSVEELRRCKVNLSVVIGQAVMEKKTLSELIESGFSYRDLEDFGYDFVLLLSAGCKNVSKAHALKALLLMKFDEDDLVDLNNRDIIPTIMTMWSHFNVDYTNVEIEKNINVSNETEEESMRVDVLKSFCKFYDGNINNLRCVTAQHISAIFSFLSRQEVDAVGLRHLAVRALQMMSCRNEAVCSFIIHTIELKSFLVNFIDNQHCDEIKCEALKLIKNVTETCIDKVVEVDCSMLLLNFLSDDDASSQSKMWAAYILYMLCKCENIIQIVKGVSGDQALAQYVGGVVALCADPADSLSFLLQGMESVTKNCVSDVRNCFIDDGVLAFLSNLLKACSDKDKCHVLSILCNICQGCRPKELAYIKAFILKPVTVLLEASLDHLVEKVIKILLLFVENNSANKLEIAEIGAIQALLKVLNKNNSSKMKIEALTLLTPLAAEESNSVAIVNKGALDTILDMLYEEDEDCQEGAASLLRTLAYVSAHRVTIANEGGIDPLIAMIREAKSSSCKIMAARALRNLAYNCDDNKTAIANLGGIPELITFLEEDHITGDVGKIVAAGVLQNLAYKRPKNVKLMIEGNVLPLLADILLYGSGNAKGAAAGCVRNIANDNTNCIAVYRSGVLEALISVFRSDTGPCHTAAKDALRTIAQNNMCRTNIKLAGIDKNDINYKQKAW